MDPKRKEELKIEARKNRIKWVEDGRRINEEKYEKETRNSVRLICSQLIEALPSAVELHDFLDCRDSGISCSPTDKVERMVDILIPLSQNDVDSSLLEETIPLPSHDHEEDSYDVLIIKLKHPLASEIVNLMEQFVVRFDESCIEMLSGSVDISQAMIDNQMAKIHASVKKISQLMRENDLWKNESDELWGATLVSLLRLVLFKVYDSSFALLLDAPREAAIAKKLQRLKYADFSDLCGYTALANANELMRGHDVDRNFSKAMQSLKRVDSVRSPLDKANSIVSCVDSAVQFASAAANIPNPGADELLPILIAVVVAACPRNLHSNIKYINTFATSIYSRSGKEAYAVTQISSALHFLEHLDPSHYQVLEAQGTLSGNGNLRIDKACVKYPQEERSQTFEANVDVRQEISANEISAMRKHGRSHFIRANLNAGARSVHRSMRERWEVRGTIHAASRSSPFDLSNIEEQQDKYRKGLSHNRTK